MEKTHRNRLSQKFGAYIKGQRVICLGIPDDYAYMDPELVKRLHATVPRHLGS
jgi:predicted protein tyrosine phosphatase